MLLDIVNQQCQDHDWHS